MFDGSCCTARRVGIQLARRVTSGVVTRDEQEEVSVGLEQFSLGSRGDLSGPGGYQVTQRQAHKGPEDAYEEGLDEEYGVDLGAPEPDGSKNADLRLAFADVEEGEEANE